MTNNTILNFRIFNYFQLLKIFSNHFHEEEFDTSRNSLYAAIFGPPAVLFGFFIVSPLSLYKNIMVFGSIVGSYANFFNSVSEDVRTLAKSDSVTGLEIREIFKKNSVYNPETLTFEEYTERTLKERKEERSD